MRARWPSHLKLLEQEAFYSGVNAMPEVGEFRILPTSARAVSSQLIFAVNLAACLRL